MDITFDVVSQLPRLLKEIISIIQEPLEAQRQKRGEFFDSEIVPIHESMTAINEDYTKTFAELLGLLKSERDVARTIELLKKRRLALIAKRKDVQAYADELEVIKKRGYIKKREISAFVDYAESIRSYMRGATPVDMRVSWYSAFIDEFEGMVRRGESPYRAEHFSSIASGRSPVELVKSAYEDAIQNDLPQAWKEYSGAFHKLRFEMKR